MCLLDNKLFSIKNNTYSYLYESNLYRTAYEANKFSSDEEGLTRMEKFFRLNSERKDFDVSKVKFVKSLLLKKKCRRYKCRI